MALRFVVGFEHQHIGARPGQPEIPVACGIAEMQPGTQVDPRTVGRDRLKTSDPPERDRRALAERAMTDLQRHRDRLRPWPIFAWLHPEIMRENRGCGADEAGKAQNSERLHTHILFEMIGQVARRNGQ